MEQIRNPFFNKSKSKDLRKYEGTNEKKKRRKFVKNGEKGRSREKGREERGGDGVVFLCCKERKCAHQEYIYIYTKK